MSDFEPRIVGFLCNWCSYAGADLAGVSRYQCPPNLRVIRVLCSTRITPHIILEVFKAGADAVLVGGCHPGDCHYISGNYYTEKRIAVARRLMEVTGLDPGRLRLEWISASEGKRFTEVVADFVDNIREMGASPVMSDARVRMGVTAAISAAQEWRLRLLNGKEIKVTEKGNVYGTTVELERIDHLIQEAVQEEFQRNMILQLTKVQPYSVRELADELDRPANEVLDHVVALRSNNLLSLDHIDGSTLKYRAINTGGEPND